MAYCNSSESDIDDILLDQPPPTEAQKVVKRNFLYDRNFFWRPLENYTPRITALREKLIEKQSAFIFYKPILTLEELSKSSAQINELQMKLYYLTLYNARMNPLREAVDGLADTFLANLNVDDEEIEGDMEAVDGLADTFLANLNVDDEEIEGDMEGAVVDGKHPKK
ncbi:hypothetical protein K7X08_028528 [Anisodus acutangulus]|uniref:Uncharacterized protein n=1 Tax=Anisodus acutangulus TaxID=402998 RepID=A0A9Q1REY7_9SOLA|nr:hypothetical protein K7X08_028528 [Anisodus acutangulus]